MMLSLSMRLEEIAGGGVRITALWLDAPVEAKTFEEAYELARRAYFRRR